MARGFSIFLVLAGGCCCAEKASAPATQPTVIVYQDRPAAALAFAAPAGTGIAPHVLDRSQRSAGAFIGYQSITAEFFWLRTDDRIRFGRGGHDRYERRAVSTRVGVIER